jgi:hypothetical protein
MSADFIPDQYQKIGTPSNDFNDTLSSTGIGSPTIPPADQWLCHPVIAVETIVLCNCSSAGFTKLDMTGEVILGELLILQNPLIMSGGFTALLNAT